MSENQTNDRLLPAEAYPDFWDDAMCDHVDEGLRAGAHLIPTTPGRYLDAWKTPWTLGEDGRWVDETGDSRDVSWNPIIATFCPMTPVE